MSEAVRLHDMWVVQLRAERVESGNTSSACMHKADDLQALELRR